MLKAPWACNGNYFRHCWRWKMFLNIELHEGQAYKQIDDTLRSCYTHVMCKSYLLWKHLILEKKRELYLPLVQTPSHHISHSLLHKTHTLSMGKEKKFPNFSKKHKFTFCNQSSLLHFVTKFLLLLLWKFGLFLDQDSFCSFLFFKKTWIEKRGCIQASSPYKDPKLHTTSWR